MNLISDIQHWGCLGCYCEKVTNLTLLYFFLKVMNYFGWYILLTDN